MTAQDSTIEYRDLTATERKLITPLIDTVTAHVSGCSGYELIGASGVLVGAEFKYPGGTVPLALDPSKPAPYLVDLVTRAIHFSKIVNAVLRLNPLGG